MDVNKLTMHHCWTRVFSVARGYTNGNRARQNKRSTSRVKRPWPFRCWSRSLLTKRRSMTGHRRNCSIFVFWYHSSQKPSSVFAPPSNSWLSQPDGRETQTRTVDCLYLTSCTATTTSSGSLNVNLVNRCHERLNRRRCYIGCLIYLNYICNRNIAYLW